MVHKLLYINQFYFDTNRLCNPAIGNYAKAKCEFILKLGTGPFFSNRLLYKERLENADNPENFLLNCDIELYYRHLLPSSLYEQVRTSNAAFSLA